jgi:hypothetical protein
MASSFPGAPESMVALVWNPWTTKLELVVVFIGIRKGIGAEVDDAGNIPAASKLMTAAQIC